MLATILTDRQVDTMKLWLLGLLLGLVVSATAYFATDVSRRAEERVEVLNQQFEMLEELKKSQAEILEDTRALRARLNIVRKEAASAKQTADAVAEVIGVDATAIQAHGKKLKKEQEKDGEGGGLFGVFGEMLK